MSAEETTSGLPSITRSMLARTLPTTLAKVSRSAPPVTPPPAELSTSSLPRCPTASYDAAIAVSPP
ncbi:hypothetical protein GCM10023350_50640 [Nocardioides endophyticus]|uniref:Uncharacterized protein n=1 Tax=Nocardioides endophyticus TaxID=1353775 RepID=A0ABP8ZJW4_9ACTN